MIATALGRLAARWGGFRVPGRARHHSPETCDGYPWRPSATPTPSRGPKDEGMTQLKKGLRIIGTERQTLGKQLVGKYEKGASIRALAEATGRSYGFVHRLLSESGVTFRGRGGNSRPKTAKR